MPDTLKVKETAKQLLNDPVAMEMLRYLMSNSYIRVVNYHNSNPCDMPRFEAEIKYYAKYFSPVTIKDLDTLMETGQWTKEKPGLIPAIFEGYRNNYDVMLPILNKYSFTGWFYLPSYFMDVPVSDQLRIAEERSIDIWDTEQYPDGRYALNWDEVREIAENHEICCHTGNHFEIKLDTPDEIMYDEIILAKRHLEANIQKPVDVFCWLYGKEFSYNSRAAKYILDAGYRYVLSNMKMEKVQ